ncbi:MAG: hypothetical protein P9L94_02100 [Candidatus Hinthialibacter antarcticus]|nr:hypothetical protein [Candidatus Hinthialibacter antarcticus]
MKWMAGLCLLAASTAPLMAEEPKEKDNALYAMNFEKEDLGYSPMDFLVLEGDFQVEQQEENRVLTLPGQPLNTMGFLFGPTEYENIRVSARFLSENVKRRYPRFGVGLCGVMGYKLRINQASRSLELYLGDDVVAKSPYKWKSGAWAHIVMQLLKSPDGKWSVQGKAWMEGEKEPEAWMLEFAATEEPISGRPTAWATPYSSRPIYIDDLKVEKVK